MALVLHSTYEIKDFDLIDNEQCHFHKLLINGTCQIDDFIQSTKKNSQETNIIAKILGRMEEFNPNELLPKTKFRHIDGGKKYRKDVFEFKEKNIRIYVILIKPDVYVVYGGYKKNQEKDIRRLMMQINQFNQFIN